MNVWMILFKQCYVISIVTSMVSVDYLIICGLDSIWIACGTTILSFMCIYLSAFHLKWQSRTESHVSHIKSIYIYLNFVRIVRNIALTVIESVIWNFDPLTHALNWKIQCMPCLVWKTKKKRTTLYQNLNAINWNAMNFKPLLYSWFQGVFDFNRISRQNVAVKLKLW